MNARIFVICLASISQLYFMSLSCNERCRLSSSQFKKISASFCYLRWYILIIKPNRCTNNSNLFLEWNSTCFRQFLCPSSEDFLLFTVHTAMVCAIQVCWQLESRIRMGLRYKNKFEKLVHLTGFIIRIYHEARSHERQNGIFSSSASVSNHTLSIRRDWVSCRHRKMVQILVLCI